MAGWRVQVTKTEFEQVKRRPTAEPGRALSVLTHPSVTGSHTTSSTLARGCPEGVGGTLDGPMTVLESLLVTFTNRNKEDEMATDSNYSGMLGGTGR
jgi:hypothetical protein